MKSKYRILFDRTGEPLQRIEPGFFGWSELEWFSMNRDSLQRAHAIPLPTSGQLSIGLRLGHAFQYLTQVAVGRAPLAGVSVEIASADGKRHQVNFRDVEVVSTRLSVDGIGSAEIQYDFARF
jgi:hypothetical protein